MKHERGSSAFRMLLIIFVILFGGIFLYHSLPFGKGKSTSKARLSGSLKSKYAPPFVLKTIHGEEFQSSRLMGKPVVLNFFTTWCPACREEIPGFINVYEKYKESGLELIGIAIEADAKTLSDFIATHKINYRILMGNMETVRAHGSFRSVPTTFFIGKDGKIKEIKAGYINKEVFEKEVQKLL